MQCCAITFAISSTMLVQVKCSQVHKAPVRQVSSRTLLDTGAPKDESSIDIAYFSLHIVSLHLLLP